MADSAFGPGSIVRVQQFQYPTQPLLVVIESSDNVGSGATARIYTGRAGPPGYTYMVALKGIPDLLDKSKQKVLEQLIHREVDAISRLSERQMRCMLPFIGTASMQFHMIIASAFMRNGNLLQYFRAKPNTDRQQLVIQVAEGVYWLHEFAGIVHGDLKCENVLVNDEGDAIIADFGLSTLVEQEASNITTITAVRGMNTLRFAAPELLFPPERAKMDERPRSKTRESDVYAFGMLALQAFSGMRPWAGLSDYAIVAKLMNHTTHPRPSDDVTMRGLTNCWWAVCLRCWEWQPYARPTMEWIWETLEKKRRKPRIMILDIEGLSCIALTPDGRRVATGTSDGTVAIWDAGTGEPIGRPVHGHTAPICGIVASPDGLQVCSLAEHSTIRTWDVECGEPIGMPITGHEESVIGVAFSQDNTRIVSCSSDQTVRVWSATTGEVLGDLLRGHIEWVRCVAFSPDGTCIACASYDGAICLWSSVDVLLPHSPRVWLRGQSSADMDIATRQLARVIDAHPEPVASVAVSPAGRYIASVSHDESIRIWDAQTGEAIADVMSGHTGWIPSLSFFPDGRSLASSSIDGTVSILNLFD